MIATENELKTLKGIIYIIKNKINWKRYVGQTRVTFCKRYHGNKWWEWRKINDHLKNAVNKYGPDNFEVEIILSNQSLEALDYWEIFYINYFQSNDNRFGYNTTTGGNAAGFKFNKNGRLKMSISFSYKLEEFIKKSKQVHGDKFDYSLCKIEPYNNKSIFICKTCQSQIIQNRSSHLGGCGCQKCELKKRHRNRVVSFEEFVERANKKHNNQFIYFPDNYAGIISKIKMIHKECGCEFYSNGVAHLDCEYSCPNCCYKKGVCKGEKQHMAKLTQKEVRKIRELYNTNEYSYGEIAEMFDISFSSISNIVKRKSWKHI